ncbi:MAG: hypothetical protein QM736_24970 [Vicinamibacterales bacterium]
MIVFFLCGLWHGATWTFVVWGLFHGAVPRTRARRARLRVLSGAPAPARHALRCSSS